MLNLFVEHNLKEPYLLWHTALCIIHFWPLSFSWWLLHFWHSACHTAHMVPQLTDRAAAESWLLHQAVFALLDRMTLVMSMRMHASQMKRFNA